MIHPEPVRRAVAQSEDAWARSMREFGYDLDRPVGWDDFAEPRPTPIFPLRDLLRGWLFLVSGTVLALGMIFWLGFGARAAWSRSDVGT